MTQATPHAVTSSNGRRPPKRRALVLAGGGMRVAYQAGVVLALEQAGLTFDLMDGASGGTMNLAMLLSGLSGSELCRRWRTLDVRRFASLLSLREYLTPGGLPAFGGADGIREHVFPHLGIDVVKIRRAESVQATFNVCNYTDKVNVALPHQDIDIERLIAGVSLPMFMPPVEHGGKLWLDAVWIKDANLSEVVRRGAEEIWLVWCIGNTPIYSHGTLEQYVHMIEISANASLFEEFAGIRELNARLAAGERSPFGQTCPVSLHVIKPDYALPLDPEYFLGHIDADTLVGMGYADARRYLASSADAGVPLDEAATRMQAPRRGVAFRERWSGDFELARSGAANHTARALTLHAAVDVPELARFGAEGGALYGSIDVEGWGEGLPLFDGRFRLQSATPGNGSHAGAGKAGVSFEARFRSAGADYRFVLACPPDPSFRGKGAFGPAEFRLFDCAAGSDRMLGRGSLSAPGGLTTLLASLRSTGTEGALEAAEVLLEFGMLYAGRAGAAFARKQKPWWKFW